MSVKLRDLIRAVRACKTAAEERAVITKECALIRTAIKEEDEQFRHRNVAKLMYIHMLGYPTHFGQMECLKLVSAVTFPEKRIGYLGLTLLLNEQAEVLTLVTNSLKLDLTNSNQYIQALSLIAIGNLATQDMARDLISDVERILRGNNPYLKKKAALATIRLLRKEPDLVEHISERIVPLLKDRAHGVLITALQLLSDIFELCPEQQAQFLKIVPSLVRLLKNFLSAGFSPEHDVGGVTDPFMQVKLLHVLRQLGCGNPEASESMSDVLAQAATSTETARNSGNAVLYECVKTIMGIESDASLRTLAINILGRFLLNRDNNIRHVALNSLTKVIHEDNDAVQRHRNTIVDCLKDPDISIRQRALELVYQLVNSSNVEILTNELLNYLIVCTPDVKNNLVSHIINIVEKFSPTLKWKVNTIITMLSMAGTQVDDDVVSTSITFLSQCENFYPYIVHRIYRMLQEDTSQTGFLHVGIWCIGEYGNFLLNNCPLSSEFDIPHNVNYNNINEKDIILILSKFSKLYNAEITTKGLILNSLMKFTSYITLQSNKILIQEIMEPFRHSMNLELQQRSNEYNMLMTKPEWSNLRHELLAKMPVIDEAALRRKKSGVSSPSIGSLSPLPTSNINNNNNNLLDDVLGVNTTNNINNTSINNINNNTTTKNYGNDLLDIFGSSTSNTTNITSVTTSTPVINNTLSIFDNISTTSSNNVNNNVNMVTDIFNTSASISNNKSTTNNANILDLFGSSTNTNTNTTPPPVPFNNNINNNNPLLGLTSNSNVINNNTFINNTQVDPNITAYDKNGLHIVLECSKPEPGNLANTLITCRFSNTTQQQITNLVFQVAVAKYMKLEMFPPSSTSVAALSRGQVTQQCRLLNQAQGEKSLALKIKLSFVIGGRTVEDLVSVTNFPNLY